MTWSEYYEIAFDCSDTQKIALLSRLKSFGSAKEVCEVACEFSEINDCEAFVKQAHFAGVSFDCDQLIELKRYLSSDFFYRLLVANGKPLTEELFLELDEELSIQIVEKLGMTSDDSGHVSIIDDTGRELPEVNFSARHNSKERPPNEEEARFVLESFRHSKKNIDKIIAEGLQQGVIVETPATYTKPATMVHDKNKNGKAGPIIGIGILGLFIFVWVFVAAASSDDLIFGFFIMLVVLFFTFVIYLIFNNDAHRGEPTAGLIHMTAGLCMFIEIVVAIIFVVAGTVKGQ